MKQLPLTEELDFSYLLELMPPLHEVPEYSWLPELFSIVGHERLLLLCKYAGGESIKIPTLDELNDSIDALNWFYDVFIKGSESITNVPVNLHKLVARIEEIYETRNSESSNQQFTE